MSRKPRRRDDLACLECATSYRNPGGLGLHRLRAHGIAGLSHRGRSKPAPPAPSLIERRAARAARAYRAQWDALQLRVRPVIRPDVHARFTALVARVDAAVAREIVSARAGRETAERVEATPA